MSCSGVEDDFDWGIDAFEALDLFLVVLFDIDFGLVEIAGRDVAVAVVDDDDRDILVLLDNVEYEIGIFVVEQ